MVSKKNREALYVSNSQYPNCCDTNMEASTSRARYLSEQPSVATDGSDTEPDAWMTDATLVEDMSEDYVETDLSSPSSKGKERAVQPFIPLYQPHRIRPKETPTSTPVWERPLRSAPDTNGVCEVLPSRGNVVDGKMLHFSTPSQAELPCMKQKVLKSLIRPAPNYNLPSLNYTVDLRDRHSEPIQAVVEAIAHRKGVIDGIVERMERARIEQTRAAFEQSCLTCRKEGLHCTAKVMRDRQLPCTACARTGVPCRWATCETGRIRKRKVPFDVEDDDQQHHKPDGVGPRPVKRRRVSPANTADRPQKGRRSPI